MSTKILDVKGLYKTFGGVKAVNGATFSIAKGSITAIIGPNGAGKTTAFNLISGFTRADSGSVEFNGQRIDRMRGDAVARVGLVRTFQAARVLTRMSVLDNMLLAARDQPGERFGMAWIAPGAVRRREREIHDAAMARLDMLRLSRLATAYAGTLSGGQRKLLELGRTLMVEPSMILLDEPMAGVAPPLAHELMEHVLRLRAESGITICLIEHDMNVVMSVSDEVIVMDEGRVIAVGPPSTIQNNERVIEAYLGRTEAEAEPESAERPVS